jgi:hypothetical protein
MQAQITKLVREIRPSPSLMEHPFTTCRNHQPEEEVTTKQPILVRTGAGKKCKDATQSFRKKHALPFFKEMRFLGYTTGRGENVTQSLSENISLHFLRNGFLFQLSVEHF